MQTDASAERLRRRWDGTAVRMASSEQPLWRLQSDLVVATLLDRWLPGSELGRVLKTDLFDEVAGTGVVVELARRFECVTGVDVSAAAVGLASARHPELEAVTADVRDLPFEEGAFDAIVSNSTLDHFDSAGEVAVALAELARVLRPGGRLVITLDNPINPLVALRNRLPAGAAAVLRRVPYGVGWTCGPRTLRRLLSGAGFAVGEQTAVLHFPRVVLTALDRGSLGGDDGGWTRWLRAAEALGRLPTRYITGHFVAMVAVRGRGGA